MMVLDEDKKSFLSILLQFDHLGFYIIIYHYSLIEQLYSLHLSKHVRTNLLIGECIFICFS